MPNEPGSEAALSVEDQIAALTAAMETLTGLVMEFASDSLTLVLLGADDLVEQPCPHSLFL